MKQQHPDQLPSLLYANAKGEIKEFDELLTAGRSGFHFELPKPADFIPLPQGSELFVLPGRFPVGWDPVNSEIVKLTESPDNPEEGIQAVAAFIAPAHTATYWAAYETQQSPTAPLLPLFAYTAVGWHDERFWVAAFRSDPSRRQDAEHFDPDSIRTKTHKLLKRFPHNRLVQHLGKCSLTYSCPAAKNFFQGREEAPLPTSPSCNADCVGCISLQPSGCCPSTQERIKFIPSPEEIAEIATLHLQKVKHGVVSFGQGCEGEPLLQAATIGKAIRQIRNSCLNGTINCNTNAGLPKAVGRLAKEGLDSIRVSLNSARPDKHSLYYRPKSFSFTDVQESIKVMKQAGGFVSLNYFILPGFTDCPEEIEALYALIEETRPDFIQLRNLNMDPELYLRSVDHVEHGHAVGIRPWLAALKKEFSWLKFGYFNPALR